MPVASEISETIRMIDRFFFTVFSFSSRVLVIIRLPQRCESKDLPRAEFLRNALPLLASNDLLACLDRIAARHFRFIRHEIGFSSLNLRRAYRPRTFLHHLQLPRFLRTHESPS